MQIAQRAKIALGRKRSARTVGMAERTPKALASTGSGTHDKPDALPSDNYWFAAQLEVIPLLDRRINASMSTCMIVRTRISE